ncbi:MAG TPA: hypothetical protein VME23_09575 [Terracidiphilus sp.]|nr:hypothetical protein [Terracidiphilus sp.]
MVVNNDSMGFDIQLHATTNLRIALIVISAAPQSRWKPDRHALPTTYGEDLYRRIFEIAG